MEVSDACRKLARSLVAEIGPWGNQCAFFGGLIPGMLVPEPKNDIAPHIGTRDVDLAVRVATWADDEQAYRTLKQNLTNLGLRQSNVRSFEWHRDIDGYQTVVELFVPVDSPEQAGKIQKKPTEQSGSGLTALGIYGLELIDRDIQIIEDEGHLLDGRGIKKVSLRVCGPAMFLCLKAWALRERTKSKDGYDVVWMLKAMGADTVAARFRETELQKTDFGNLAINHLREHFSTHQHTGPQGWIIESGFEGELAHLEAREAMGIVQEFLESVSS